MSNFTYRPDIDGLRAVAVLAVVIFHADLHLPGGYIGVDIFFVISGFLITSIIWKDLENNRFTFVNFWERRARRIVPPLVVMTVVVMIAGFFVLLPADFKNLGSAAASQSIFGANIHYYFDLNYFSGEANEKPLLHTWSLAVEEQFYIFVPILFYLIYKKNKRASLIKILLVFFAVSFALSVYGTYFAPSAAFYLLSSRAWELLAGSILAFLPACSIERRLRELIAVAAFLMLVAPMFIYTERTVFPGIAALPVCLGTALLIKMNEQPTLMRKALSLPLFVAVGSISYSLYLWHWIFFAYARYIALFPLSLTTRVLLVGLSFLLAIVSYKFIETPFRVKQVSSSRKAIFVFASSSLATVLILGTIIFFSDGLPQRYSIERKAFADAVSDVDFINEMSSEDVRSGNFVTVGAQGKKPSIMIWGDSHAMSMLPAFDEFLKEKNLTGVSATHSATAPVLGWYYRASVGGLNEKSLDYNNEVFLYVRKNQISDVVLVGSWGTYYKEPEFGNILNQTVRALTTNNVRVWIMLDVPRYLFSVPKALSRGYTNKDLEDFALIHDQSIYADLQKLEQSGAIILDPKPLFKDMDGGYMLQRDGVALYRDSDHLTVKGAKLILLPFLRQAFETLQ